MQFQALKHRKAIPGHICFKLAWRLADLDKAVLDHQQKLGLKRNLQKSDLLLGKQTAFLGVDLNSYTMCKWDCLLLMSIHFAFVHINSWIPVSLFCRLLGLLAVASPMVALGLSHMRLFQWWVNSWGVCPCWHPHCTKGVTHKCYWTLLTPKHPRLLTLVVPLGWILSTQELWQKPCH